MRRTPQDGSAVNVSRQPFPGTDGWRNGVELWAVTNFDPVWSLLRRVPKIRSRANRLIVNQMVYKMRPRPEPLSTRTAYTTWDSLQDRTYSARHLPPNPALQQRLPHLDRTAELFARPGDRPIVSNKSTLLFPHFAQWFVDGFLRTDPTNPLKNTSTHDIDLSQLYGQTGVVTDMLRSGVGGRLKSQVIEGEEYPPYYFDAEGRVKTEFAELPLSYPGNDVKAVSFEELEDSKKRRLFALGIPRGNIHYGFVMMSTVFLREHNRIAALISRDNPRWSDEQLFQTTRNCLIVIMLKIVVEDYINHITPFPFKLFVEPGFGGGARWYRENWMSIEFDLLYRWHPLVPDRVCVGGAEREMVDLLWDTEVVTTHGVARLFDEASRQPSTEIGLLNSPALLIQAERHSAEMGRAAELTSFNDYRQICRFPRLKSFSEFSSREEVQAALAARYRSVDDVELYVGLFAEDVRVNAALPTLMGTMVAVDAFSQALTNPLLSERIFNEQTFSPTGKKEVDGTSRLEQVVVRNVPKRRPRPLVTLTRQDWKPAR